MGVDREPPLGAQRQADDRRSGPFDMGDETVMIRGDLQIDLPPGVAEQVGDDGDAYGVVLAGDRGEEC